MQSQPSQERQVSDDEQSFKDWLSHPETIRFRAFLRASRRKRLEAWANGQYVGDNETRYIAQNSAQMGYCNALDELAKLDYDTLMEGFSDEE